MRVWRVLAATCAAGALAVSPAATASKSDVGPGPAVVFTVFGSLPPSDACPGIYAVDARTRQISWLGGFDAATQDFAVYPRFTAGGWLSYGSYDRASQRVPLVDIYVNGRRVTQAVAYTRHAWAPRREELVFGRLDRRGRLELAIASAAGRTRRAGPPVAIWPTWTPDGAGLVYPRGAGGGYVLTFVSRDGRVMRNLARDVRQYPAPQVSPDGRRVAFVRWFRAGTREELWVVGIRGVGARRVLGPVGSQSLGPVAWLSHHELLFQSGDREDTIFDMGDTLGRLDVDSGRRRPFLRRAFGLGLSPDRSKLLFVRRHLAAGETYYSIRTVRVDGRGEQVLAVTDEEDLNVGSIPVWKPATASVAELGDPPPPQLDPQDCVRRVTSLRDRTR